jgi:tetratricopeptide (TPR) repeat protein
LVIKGSILIDLKKYEEAIECLEKIVNLILIPEIVYSNDSGTYKRRLRSTFNIMGIAYAHLGKYIFAIDCFDKAIKLHELYYPEALANKGFTFFLMKEYSKAIKCYNESLSVNVEPFNYMTLNNKGVALSKLGKYHEAAECFITSKLNILAVLLFLDKEEGYTIAKIMLDKDAFFQDVTGSVAKNIDYYKDIYLKSLQIVCLLFVDSHEECEVAHYTSKEVSKLLILNESKFRQSLVTVSNDPKEGKTLLDYLFDKDMGNGSQDKTHFAFASSFTFNHDHSNQFRLYGKENNEEFTGVSIVVDNSFFSSQLKNSVFQDLNTTGEKQPLFRCIYIDTQTGHIETLGQKEEYTFYREGGEGAKNDLKKYRKKINKTLSDMRQNMSELKFKIQHNNLDSEIISRLLIYLRYLVKSVGWKTEQECRIIRIESQNDEFSKDRKTGNSYFDYLYIQEYVTKLYFGAKTSGLKSYINMLRNQDLYIECIQTENFVEND